MITHNTQVHERWYGFYILYITNRLNLRQLTNKLRPVVYNDCLFTTIIYQYYS